MGVLTKEQILQAKDLPTKEIEVPEWGGSVMVRGLTGTERDKFEASCLMGQGKNMQVVMRDLRAKLVAKCVVDEKGERLFSDAEVAVLGQKSAVALNRVFTEAQSLSGLTEEEVKGLAEGLDGAPSEGSTSV